jgi:DNA-binding MarR family transcriptional regulator
MLEFLPLFHRKFASAFHQSPDIRYQCGKNQNKTIMIIKKKGKITPTDLGMCLDMKKGSLTSLVDSLEKMQLVRRETDSSDRRKTFLSLTGQGEAYVLILFDELEKHMHRLFERASIDRVETFEECLGSLIEILRKL